MSKKPIKLRFPFFMPTDDEGMLIGVNSYLLAIASGGHRHQIIGNKYELIEIIYHASKQGWKGIEFFDLGKIRFQALLQHFHKEIQTEKQLQQ